MFYYIRGLMVLHQALMRLEEGKNHFLLVFQVGSADKTLAHYFIHLETFDGEGKGQTSEFQDMITSSFVLSLGYVFLFIFLMMYVAMSN
jgi:hypothetical protein